MQSSSPHKEPNIQGALVPDIQSRPPVISRPKRLGPHKRVPVQVQIGLFWETLCHARLVAINHPRPVYYHIWLETMVGCGYRVRKKSGIVGRSPDKRIWPFDRLGDAIKFYDAKIRDKTNLYRNSPRKYRIDDESELLNMPKCIQRKRIKGWRMPAGTVYVGRPSRWGNPFSVDECGSPQKAVREFKKFVDASPEFRDQIISELRGKDLACWCPLDTPCHADVLLKIANR